MYRILNRYTVYHLNVTNRFLVLYLTTKKTLIMRATFVFALKLWDYQDNGDNMQLPLPGCTQTIDPRWWEFLLNKLLWSATFPYPDLHFKIFLISILFLKHCIRRIVHVMFRHLPKTILSNLLNIMLCLIII